MAWGVLATVGVLFYSRNSPQPWLDSPKQNCRMAKDRKMWGGGMDYGKYSLLNDIKTWLSCSVVPRGCVNRLRLWPLRRDDHSGVLIDALYIKRNSKWE